MIINAVAADLVDVHFDADQCVMKVEAVAKGNSFDYDVESKTRMSATKAKLTRFFDVVADSKTPLTTRFVIVTSGDVLCCHICVQAGFT